VLPATSKYLIDDVVGKRNGDLLVILAVWTYQDAVGKFLMKGEPAERRPYWPMRT